MASKVKTVPDGWHSVTPFLSVKDAARAVEFYRKVFGATELERGWRSRMARSTMRC